MMKLLMIAPELYPVPSAKGTSVETCMYHLASQLAEQHEVTILCKRGKGLSHEVIRGNLRIIRLPGKRKNTYLQAVIRYLKSNTFDIVQIDNRPTWIRQIKKHAPHSLISLFLHSLTYVDRPKAKRSSVRRQLRHADMMIANSASLKRQLTTRFPKQAYKIKVVRLGVDPTIFRPPSPVERRRIRAKYKAQGTFALVYAGRFIPLKGIPTLIRAAELVHKRIPQTKLYLIGSGRKKYVARMKQLARRVNVPVHFVGAVRRKAMPSMYWMADCFVCPTQGHESFGLVIVEALATGVPTVASKSGGIQEIINHRQNGLLVTAYHRPNAFAKAIRRLYQERKLARKIGINGRRTCVTRFHWGKAAGRLTRVYESRLAHRQTNVRHRKKKTT